MQSRKRKKLYGGSGLQDGKLPNFGLEFSQALAWHVRDINEGEPTGWKRAMNELGQIDIQT
jgi:hypothetical protein